MPKVVTCLLKDDKGKILILKRSNKVKTYKGRWGGVAGYVEEGEKPIDTAYKELDEEIGLNKKDVELLRIMEPFKFTDYYNGEKFNWEIHVFVFRTQKAYRVRTDWEHSDFRWITPSEINDYNTVPRFKEFVSKII